MDIFDPVGAAAVTSGRMAPRPPTLSGSVIGLLDNSKPNARVLLETVARALLQRSGARDIEVWRKPGSSTGAAAAVLDEIATRCRVAFTASAD